MKGALVKEREGIEEMDKTEVNKEEEKKRKVKEVLTPGRNTVQIDTVRNQDQ